MTTRIFEGARQETTSTIAITSDNINAITGDTECIRIIIIIIIITPLGLEKLMLRELTL